MNSQLKSSFLIIGKNLLPENQMGAYQIESLDKIKTSYPVVVYAPLLFDIKEIQILANLLKDSSSNPLRPEVILVHPSFPAENLKQAVNLLMPFSIFSQVNEKEIEISMQEALEKFSLKRQNKSLLSMVEEQNEKLTRLSTDLEKRVQKRQRYLENAKKKLLTSNFRVEALHNALVAIHQADSVGELELLLNQALDGALELSWIRILFHQQNFFEEQVEMNRFQFEIFSAPLVKERENLGQIYFAREKGKGFKNDEHNFLIQVSDAVSLAIDRLKHLEQTEALKQQWESTFDAISAPLSLIDREYKIIRCNQAYARKAGLPIHEVIGTTCYKSLFQRSTPCQQCQLGKKFRLSSSGKDKQTFEVSSQKLNSSTKQDSFYVVIYHGINEQLRLERKVIESAKMAEIGTIGSSIAHEINNPLGGMISFLQLIKSDLEGDEDFYEDIIEMEKGAQACKSIVQDLLSFSRKPQIDEVGPVDLKEVVDQAIKLTELQTRSRGIELIVKYPIAKTFINGQKNLLTQAIRHLLQNSSHKFSQRSLLDKNSGSKIFVSIEEQDEFHKVNIKTHREEELTKENLPHDSDVSLTVTNQIINEHSGHLEFFSGPEDSVHFTVVLPRLES